jgi:hypothetical protein
MAVPDSQYDIVLAGKGYLLARKEQLGHGGRAWNVTTVGSSIARASDTETRFGNQPAVIEMPMVWKSGHLGYGDELQRAEGRYFYGENIDARFQDEVLPGPSVTTLTTTCGSNLTRFIEHNGKLFLLGGRYVKSIDTSDATVHDERDLGASNAGTDMEVFGGVLYVGLGFGAGDFIHRCDAAGTWAQDDDVQAGYFCTKQDRFYASGNTYQVKSCAADPFVDGNWTSLYTIGDFGTTITGLCSLDELVYVGKTDGLHALDSNNICPCLTPELRAYKSTDNCRNLMVWHGMVYVPHIRGLLQYQPLGEQGFAVASVGPGRDVTSNCPVRGQVTALAGDDRWLYCAVYDGTNTWIMAGREPKTELEATYGRVLWHPLAKIASAKCEAMFISGLWTNPRLWFGAGSSACYIVLPANSDNPRQDSNSRYALSGSYYLGANDWKTPTTSKVWKSIEVSAENLAPTRYLDIYYSIDDGTWTLAGRASTSPTHTLSLLGEGLAGVTGHKIAVRADYVQVGAASPFVLRSIVARAAERPVQVEVITAKIRCADKLPLRKGGTCPRSGATILSDLRALATINQAATLKDIVGTSRQVLVLAPVEEQEVQQEGELAREVIATVRMAVFTVDETEYETFNFSLGGSSSGMTIPLTIPWAIGSTTLDRTETLNCISSANVSPVICITGPVTNCKIDNTTTDKQIDFTGTTIAAGDAYIIDCGKKTVVDAAGVDQSANLAAGSDLSSFYLAPGDNSFTLTGTVITGATAISCSYVVA